MTTLGALRFSARSGSADRCCSRGPTHAEGVGPGGTHRFGVIVGDPVRQRIQSRVQLDAERVAERLPITLVAPQALQSTSTAREQFVSARAAAPDAHPMQECLLDLADSFLRDLGVLIAERNHGTVWDNRA